MSTGIQARETVFPGYQLIERIGSGGYAEVWRARAPGGIDKAVKIVYGYCGDQLATQEMKAMERIKDVRHPFVLSLERFEIIDGRLAILTELADMSLEQRAHQCRAEGLPGIPRHELLGYMADTAEALDFLAERHSLQHLDIKPANLLISGDHVKVADFGLVKELASRTQNSMVAGMTPTYSAPEMFDDAPSPFSDQYSLAIVYQEMLTGVLPFPGRTAAQLANQHLRSPPQLATLPETDRDAVARALAKDPIERFPNCRAFVKSLLGAVDNSADRARNAIKTTETIQSPDGSRTPIKTPPKPAVDLPPARSPAALATQPTKVQSRGAVDTKVEPKRLPKVRPNENIVDVAAPAVGSAVSPMQPTLYIAVGGVGIQILCRFRDLLARRDAATKPPFDWQMLAIDTDRAELKEACSTAWNNPIPSSDTLHLPLRLPQEYRERSQVNLEWLSHRWLYNIPRSLETRGYRPLGRLALVDHFEKALSHIDSKLAQLAAMHVAGPNQQEPKEVRVVLLAGMGGGTGSGMAIDLANAARARIQASGRRAQLQGIFVCTCLGNASASPLSVANTYALLAELQFVSRFGNYAAETESNRMQALESRNRPFDLAYCVTTKHSDGDSVDDGLSLIANQLSLASTDRVSQMLQCCQTIATPRELAGQEPLLFRTFGSTPLAGPRPSRTDRLANQLSRTMARHWLGDASPNEWRRLDRTGNAEIVESNAAPQQCNSVEAGSAALPPSRTLAEQWRHCFDEHALSQFAYEVVTRICRKSAILAACQTPISSSKNPARFVELASQAISSISKRLAESTMLDESPSEEDEIIVSTLASRSHRVLTKLIDQIELFPTDSPFDAANIDRIIMAECATVVEECLGQNLSGAPVILNSALQADVQEALNRADVDLLQCGYDRRTLIVVPPSTRPTEAIDSLIKTRPTVTVVSANVDDPVIYCEGSGINPSSFVSGLERVYPGIAEAASRFFTRIDIDWSAHTV